MIKLSISAIVKKVGFYFDLKLYWQQSSLESGLDERRKLLERCIDVESTNNQLKTNINDLNSQLQQSISAIHELGRENQALQVEKI